MNGKIDLVVVIPNSLKKSDIVARELQVLIDGIVVKTMNIPDKGQVNIAGLEVQDTTTITMELRGIYDSGVMSAPLVHEFTIIDGVPQPQSDIFNIKIISLY